MREIEIKKHCYGKRRPNVEKHYHDNELTKVDFCALNCEDKVSSVENPDCPAIFGQIN